MTDDRKHILVRASVVLILILCCVTFLMAAQQGGAAQRAPGFFDFWLRPRVWMSLLFSLIGLGLLIRGWVTRNLRFAFLFLIAFTFGFLWILPLGSFARGLGIHPSPMCIVEKPFLFVQNGRAIPVMFLSLFASIAILTLIGAKLFCGWVCPVGALQEIMHRIPAPKIKLPFRMTNTVRITVFILFLVVLFAAGFSFYPYLNPFEFFHFGFGAVAILILAVVLAAAVFIFRPFCYTLCPLGLLTWIIEQVSLTRVRFDKEKCNDCQVCVNKSPCPTVSAILAGKRIRPDCHPCGRCIELCKEGALKFRK